MKKLLTILLLLFVSMVQAENILMQRLPVKADLAIEYLKASIQEHEYKIVHEQFCDNGMKHVGYKTDTYRVLFFGKGEEVRQLSHQYPSISTYLPLKMAVVAEKNETLLSIVNPTFLSSYYKDKKVQIILERWFNDIHSIFDDVQREVDKRTADDLQ